MPSIPCTIFLTPVRFNQREKNEKDRHIIPLFYIANFLVRFYINQNDKIQYYQMGSSGFPKLFNQLFGKRQMNALMLGLDAAGKTSILYKLKLGDITYSIPTIGFNVETVEYRKVKFTSWDLGGSGVQIRKHFYQNTQALIYVVDSSDKERIEIARDQLQKILQQDELKDAVVLVLANKQDICVMSLDQIVEKLGLHGLRGREWHIQGTCAMTEEGFREGFEWLSKITAKKQ